MLTPCGARSRICCLSYRVTRNVHRCSIGLQVTSASVSAYSICAGADIDSDFWGRPGLPLVLNGGGAPQLSLIIMRLTLEGGYLPKLFMLTRRLLRTRTTEWSDETARAVGIEVLSGLLSGKHVSHAAQSEASAGLSGPAPTVHSAYSRRSQPRLQ